MDDLAQDLADFIADAPTPYHAVAEAVRRLAAAGFTEQSESEPWADGPGGRYLVRDGTFAAWYVPGSTRPGSPLRIMAAHTDSPTLRIKPNPDVGAAGWRQVAVEVYGGALWNSWLDRDLGVAGRLALYDGSVALVDVARPLLRVPQLAIHLDRQVNQGLKLDAQQHLLPIWGLGAPVEGELIEFLAAEAGVDAAEVAAHDLVVHDLTPPARLGERFELLAAPGWTTCRRCTPGWARCWPPRSGSVSTAAPTWSRCWSASTTRRSAAGRPPAPRVRCWRTC
jgi:aspartyl aminopeptidase